MNVRLSPRERKLRQWQREDAAEEAVRGGLECQPGPCSAGRD